MLLNPSNSTSRVTTSTCNHTSITITPGSTQLLAANNRRTWFMIQNYGTSSMFLNLSATAAIANGIEVEPGNVWVGTADLNYVGDVSGISATSETVECRVIEAVR